MYWVVLIVISIIMALIFRTFFTDKEIRNDYWIWLIIALIGSFLGDYLLGDWWWMLSDYNVLAGIIGAIVFGWLYIIIFTQINRSREL